MPSKFDTVGRVSGPEGLQVLSRLGWTGQMGLGDQAPLDPDQTQCCEKSDLPGLDQMGGFGISQVSRRRVSKTRWGEASRLCLIARTWFAQPRPMAGQTGPVEQPRQRSEPRRLTKGSATRGL